MFIGLAPVACAQASAGPKGPFSIQPPQVSSETVEFSYYTPFPGLTKVLLFDDKGEMVWRGQYIDEEGENKLRLRASYLDSGESYVFQFEYKLERVRIPITAQ